MEFFAYKNDLVEESSTDLIAWYTAEDAQHSNYELTGNEFRVLPCLAALNTKNGKGTVELNEDQRIRHQGYKRWIEDLSIHHQGTY